MNSTNIWAKIPLSSKKISFFALFIFMILFGFSAITLLIIYVLQYAFGVDPCHLCLLERIPFWIACILLGLFFSIFALRRKLALRHMFSCSVLLSITYCASAALALYHTGLERLWWNAMLSCTTSVASQNAMQTLESFDQSLQTANVVACDKISWSFLSLSLTNWNLLLSLLLLGMATYIACLTRSMHKRPLPIFG